MQELIFGKYQLNFISCSEYISILIFLRHSKYIWYSPQKNILYIFSPKEKFTDLAKFLLIFGPKFYWLPIFGP